MNIALFSAGILTLALGVAHSVLGEVLIFNRLRAIGYSSDESRPILAPREWAVLWSTWHLVSLLSFGLGAVLLQLAVSPPLSIAELKPVLIATFVVTALFWVYGTRGKHPAGIVLFAIAALVSWA